MDRNDTISLVDKLRPFIVDDEMFGRLTADIGDLVEAGQWLLAEVQSKRDCLFTLDDAETFLIDLDINYIKHTSFHLGSLRKDVANILKRIAQLDEKSAL